MAFWRHVRANGFSLVAESVFHRWETLYLHYRDGRMTRELYEPQRSNMSEFPGYPGLQAVWDLRKRYHHNAFRSMVDDVIATFRSPIPDIYGESPVPSG